MICAEPAAPLRADAFQLAGIPTSVRFARELAKLTLKSWGVNGEVGDRIITSLSEVVTNAVVHACPTVPGTAFPQLAGLGLIDVRLKQFAAFLALEVWDPNQPPTGHGPSVPHLVAAGDGGEDGRGLAIVAALSSHWGVRREPIGKTVFVLFDAPPVDLPA